MHYIDDEDDHDDLTRPLIIDMDLAARFTWTDNEITSPVRMDSMDHRSAAMRVLTNRRMLMHIVAFQPSGVSMATVVAREHKLELESDRRRRYYRAAVFLGVAETVCMLAEAWLLLAILMTQDLSRSGMICLAIVFGFTILTGILGWFKFNRMGIRIMGMARKRRGKEPNCCLLWMWLFCVPTWLSQQFLSDDTHPALCLGYFCVAGPLQIVITTVSEAAMLLLFILRVYISPVTNIIGIRNLSRRHNFAGGYPDLEVDPLVGTGFSSMLDVPFVNVVQIHPLAGVVQYFARSELNLRDYRVVVGLLIHYLPLLAYSLALVAGWFENHQRWIVLPVEVIAAVVALLAFVCVVACLIVAKLQRQLFPGTFLRRSLRSFYPGRI